MTDHPTAIELDRLAKAAQWESDARTIRAGAAAIRALQALRPHHPRAVVGNRYALMAVGYDELVKAQEVVGREHDLGRFDLEAAVALVQRDRMDHFADDPEATRAKWGAKL